MSGIDTIELDCPSCSFTKKVQSKAGDCDGKIYKEWEIPTAIAGDLDGTTLDCSNCGKSFTINTFTTIHKVII